MGFAEFARRLVLLREGRRRAAEGAPELVVAGRVDSTHRVARLVVDGYAGEDAAPPPVDVVAWEQRHGRGRAGRAWSSPPGAGVYATLVRRLAAERLQSLPLVVGAAVGEALGARLGGRCRLKWPNDVMVGERKLGGILIDAVSRGDEGTVVLVGVGVNVVGEAAFPGATSLAAEGAPAPLPELCDELLASLDEELRAPAPAGAVVARYAALSAHRHGDAVRCRTPAEEVAGRFLGFDERGFLRLEVGGAERRLAAGEVMGL